MTYRPTERVFLPPLSVRLPAILYFLAASALGILVAIGTRSAPESRLYAWVVASSSNRLMTASTFATLLLVSASAALVRSFMRGVRVREDGVEFRDVVSWVWPKRRLFRWPQMDCILLDQPTRIAIDLWDGSRTFLPVVAKEEVLRETLTRVALARAIPLRGGAALDDLPDGEELLGVD